MHTEMNTHTHTHCHTAARLLIEDIECGGLGAGGVSGPLAPGQVTGLVRVPQLAAVVAELRVTSLSPTAQLGTLGTAIGNHCIAAHVNNRFSMTMISHQYTRYTQISNRDALSQT